jgi:hypothetical protein
MLLIYPYHILNFEQNNNLVDYSNDSPTLC